MVSSEVSGGDTPQARARVAVDWGRVLVATSARGIVITLLGLALWAAAPAVIGWSPTTVMTGSMEPRLRPGDVVVSRPVAPAEVREGRVLLADDPDHRGLLRMHRYVSEGPDRTIITKGDANPQSDSTPLHRSAVHGVGYLRIPYVAAPVLWARTGEWGRLSVVVLGFVGLLALCAVDGPVRRRNEAETDETDTTGSGGSGGSRATGGPVATPARGGREARHRAATGLPSDGRSDPAAVPAVPETGAAHARPAPTRRTTAHRRRRDRRVQRAGTAALLVLATAVGLASPAPAAAAAWGATTTGPDARLAAVSGRPITALSCSGSGQLTWTFPTAFADPLRFEVVANGTTLVRTVAGSVRTAPAAGNLLSMGPSTITIRAVYANETGWATTASTSVTVTAMTSLLVSCG